MNFRCVFDDLVGTKKGVYVTLPYSGLDEERVCQLVSAGDLSRARSPFAKALALYEWSSPGRRLCVVV